MNIVVTRYELVMIKTSLLCITILHLKEILLKIGVIEEMKTTCGNKKVPQTFFHYSLYSQKYHLIRLIPHHWQLCILQFCDITKGIILQKFLQTEKRDYQLVAVRSL